MKYNKLSINTSKELVFGQAPHPFRIGRGLVFGSGTVYSGANFTYAPMHIDAGTLPSIRKQYKNIAKDILNRSLHPLAADQWICTKYLYTVIEKIIKGSSLSDRMRTITMINPF